MIILGIDPGTKYMGFAVLSSPRLLAYGVRTLRNGERPYDVIGQARRVVFGLIQDYGPGVVAIERPLRIATARGALLRVIVEEMKARSAELAIRIVELAPDEAREAVVGDPRATKVTVARTLAERQFPELRSLVPKPPARAALGLRPRDKYWLHMFDALAVGLAVQRVAQPYARDACVAVPKADQVST